MGIILDLNQRARAEALQRIANELERLEKEAARIGEGMLALHLAMARQEAERAAAQ